MAENKKPRYISFEVVPKPGDDGVSMFADDAFATTETVDEFKADTGTIVQLARTLQRYNITVHHIGEFSISCTATTRTFEKMFSTEVSAIEPRSDSEYGSDQVQYAPAEGAPWELPTRGGLDELIDRAYVQREPEWFAGERALPPFWDDKFRLRVPGDVAQIMRAAEPHRAGITGHGVRVAMLDTGFYHHPYFQQHGYKFLAVTAPDTNDHTSDDHGHGTGECANLFATAPDINFIGIKMGNPTLAIKTAIDLRPDVMTNSWGYSEDVPNSTMPNWLKPLHLAVLSAVAQGITVCFSAGNGHFGFPGSMPEVISVGGVHVDEDLNYEATEYASGFDSTWFPGRSTPDICGLVGVPPTADYIVLPVQKGATIQKEEGWGAFSGTSAASPMVAGVCALLKQVDPGLTPDQIKNVLKFTALDITKGKNAHGKTAKVGPDGATGYGLVDAARAVTAVS